MEGPPILSQQPTFFNRFDGFIEEEQIPTTQVRESSMSKRKDASKMEDVLAPNHHLVTISMDVLL